jgi:RNA polymerase sigma-70 factor (ECF subfamily)
VDHLFRHEAGRITSALTRAMGARYLELAEEATQEALIKALQNWPFRGVPPQPAAWLHLAARNYALDQLRRETRRSGRESELRLFLENGNGSPAVPQVDDTLAMMLLCCHPEIPPDGRLALTLKTVSGFSTKEIAAASLATQETVAQRIVRAKKKIREEGLRIEVPESEAWAPRLDTVCDVLYCMFNEGYFASSGEVALRRDLCEEAIRLLDCVLHAGHGRPDRYALQALFHLHLARFDARIGNDGALLAWEQIDTARYDDRHIALAGPPLLAAMKADELSAWHLEAAIAGAHCSPVRDWDYLAGLYDSLERMTPSPVVRLNGAVARFHAGQRDAAFAILKQLEQQESLRGYALLPATLARLHEEAGSPECARSHYREALLCDMSAPSRQYLKRRLEQLPA